MKAMGLALIALFALSLSGWGSSGEWEQAAEIEIISDAAGIAEEFLDIASDASLELSLSGLDIELMPSFDELISDVHNVNGAISNIEKLEKKKALKEKDELKHKLEVAKTALEQGQNAQAVTQLLHFIDQVKAYREEREFTTKEADSLISKAEAIIGKIDKGKSERDFELNISATISDVELTWVLEGGSAIFPAPGKDNCDATLNFEVNADLDDLDLTLEMEHQRLEFFERWTKEKGKLVDGLDFEAEIDLGDLEITRAIEYERTFFPEGIGKEIEAARVDEAKRAIERLKQEIKISPSLSDEIKEEFTNEKSKLERALQALRDNRRDKAVNYLWDFVDLVERRRREEKISEEDTNKLIAETRAILPRKRSRVITAKTKVQFNLDDLELNIEYESTIKDLPAETKKNRRDNNLKVDLEMERADLLVQGTVERQQKLFPNDRKKDELLHKGQIEAEIDLGRLGITGTFGRETTDYPNNAPKNNIVTVRDLELELDLGLADYTLSFEREETRYPNNAPKDKLVEGFEFKLEFAQPEFTIDLEREVTTYPNNAVKDKIEHSAAFQLGREIAGDLELSLAADFTVDNYPNDLAKNKSSASFEVALQQGF